MSDRTTEPASAESIADEVANLSPAKRALLEARLEEQRRRIAQDQRIPRRADRAPIPLSFAQQRLWFLDRWQPDSSAVYNTALAYRLAGALDKNALERGLNEVVRRHEILRTTFVDDAGEPVQRIASTLQLELPISELRDEDDSARRAEIDRLVSEELRRPFDLALGPLLRAKLLRLGDHEHILLLVIHHIVTDGWSQGVLLRELSVLYGDHLTGKPSFLPEPPVQYGDYSVWQRQRLQGTVLARQLGYWRRQLDGVGVLELPTDRPRPAVQSFRGGGEISSLSPALSEALRELSRRQGATLFMTLLAAFRTLLLRYTGQEDVAVGTPIANRNRLELEEIVGLFVNTLALRTTLVGDPTFRDLLSHVRAVTLAAHAHQDLPFEKLVQELSPDRDTSRTPLFQVMFILQNAPGASLELAGLTAEPWEVHEWAAKYDLTLTFTEEVDGLRGRWEYNTDLFDRQTIERMIGHYQTLLEGIVEDPDRRLSQLPLLTEAERHRLLVEWNDTRVAHPEDTCIHDLFEAQEKRTPEALAVAFGERKLTYRELNESANQLARHLQAQGVGPEVLVGICVERSLQMVVGLLGILKSGGAYVPLDPAYPKQRLAFMLNDAQAPVLVTQQPLAADLPAPGARVICLDRDRARISEESEENPAGGVSAENLAYVIYTSGSTGRPKGVLGLHRGAVNRFRWMWDVFPFQPWETCCQAVSLSFVDSVWEIFGPLLQGIPIHIASDSVLKDPGKLIEFLAVNHVTRIVLVPSLLAALLRSASRLSERLPELKYWVTSGEALSADLSRAFAKRMPESVLLDLYGSSEVSGDVTWHDTEGSRGLPRVPIGRPLANTRTYVVDRQMLPVPVGVTGELLVGGAGLARGYLNRPGLTAERFIPDPFSNEPEARLYRTGDLARYRPNGNIEFLGRMDHQVKIRGFRIELGEIESVLGRHPGIREAAVLAREDVPDDKHLVAYAVSAAETAPKVAELRALLAHELPAHMIPSVFVFLKSLPLSPSGKVDRGALPAPERGATEADLVAPRDRTELQLTSLWEQVLRRNPIGVTEDFFELGGHSLMAVQLFVLIEAAFGEVLPIATLLRAPTIEKMAGVLRDRGHSARWSSLVPIHPWGSRPPLFCVHGVTGDPFIYRHLAAHLGDDQPLYGLQARGLDRESAPHRSIDEMAAHYVVEMRALQPRGPYHLGGFCFGGTVAFEIARQLQTAGEQVDLLALFDAHAHVTRTLPARVALRWWLSQYLRRARCHFGTMRGHHGLRAKIAYLSKAVRSRAAPTLEPAGTGPLAEIHLRAIRGYAPGFYPGKVTVFRSETARQTIYDPLLGWQVLARDGVEIRDVQGFHHGMFDEPHVAVLAERLRQSLEAGPAAAQE